MTIREYQQIASLILSAIIVICSAYYIKCGTNKLHEGSTFLLFGLIGFLFYLDLVSNNMFGSISHVISPTRTLVQYSLVATYVIVRILNFRREG